MATFPTQWWHGRRTLIFGHRGASHTAPQNTLAAFRAAVEAGADGVELDVHLSADGVPVVIHDAQVGATTDGSGRVQEMTLAQLKALDAGRTFAPEFAGERIPTLEEVFAEVGDRLLINIELKPQPRGVVGLEEAVVALVRRMGMQERVWFSSFKPYALYTVRRLAPEIPCGLLYSVLNVGTLWLLPFTPHEALHPHHPLVNARMVRRAHRRGMRVVTWTVDDPDAAARMVEWGVDVIITNEPAALVRALAQRG